MTKADLAGLPEVKLPAPRSKRAAEATTSAEQPLVHDLAAPRQPHGIADVLVEHGLARFLVPNGRKEVEQVAAEQRAAVGGHQRGHILRTAHGDAVHLMRISRECALALSARFGGHCAHPEPPA